MANYRKLLPTTKLELKNKKVCLKLNLYSLSKFDKINNIPIKIVTNDDPTKLNDYFLDIQAVLHMVLTWKNQGQPIIFQLMKKTVLFVVIAFETI